MKLATISNVTSTNRYETTTSAPTIDRAYLEKVLSLAIPLSCLTLILVVAAAIGIRQRHRVLDKWASLRRMRNTNPRFLRSTGLRRDSEFESFDGNQPVISHENALYQERVYRLKTIA